MLFLVLNFEVNMSIKETICKTKPREVSGSRTLNAYSYQIDICAYLILKLLKSDKDFLALVDYLDDIVILDNKDNPEEIIFYQVKTSTKEISMTTILKEEWLNHIEENLESFKDDKVNSILLTNTEILCHKKKFKTDNDKYVINEEYDRIKTLKESLPSNEDGKKIVDIITTYIKKESLDKISILKSKFTLEDHDNQLLGKFTDFLADYEPKFDMAALKSIYHEFVCVLKNLSKNTYNQQEIVFDDLIKSKGFSRKQFNNICDKTKKMMIPTVFDTIYNFAINTLRHKFKKNIICIKDDYRDFGIKASCYREAYDKITNALDKIDLKQYKNEDLFSICKAKLDKDKEINVLDFYNKYNEFIILVYLFKC